MLNAITIAPEILTALSRNKPIVALESTLIAHGLPWPENLQTAQGRDAGGAGCPVPALAGGEARDRIRRAPKRRSPTHSLPPAHSWRIGKPPKLLPRELVAKHHMPRLRGAVAPDYRQINGPTSYAFGASIQMIPILGDIRPRSNPHSPYPEPPEEAMDRQSHRHPARGGQERPRL
jgi:hypothetical protein